MRIKAFFPHYFKNKRALDVGGADINGSVRFLFEECDYNVIDIWQGPGVDMVGKVTELSGTNCDDVVCYLEVAEHDNEYQQSIAACINRLKPGGLFLFTCASTGREEHGTKRTTPECSPFTTDYYKNVTEEDVRMVPGFNDAWAYSKFEINGTDLYFFGIKKGVPLALFQPSLFIFIKSYFQYWSIRIKKDIKNRIKSTFLNKILIKSEKFYNFK